MSQERDLRKYARATTIRLVVGVILIVFVIGDGLIFLIYGQDAGQMALISTGLGLAPLVLVGIMLWFLGWFARSVSGE